MDYNITLEKEVIREMSANCLAAISRYFEKKEISDNHNISDPMAIAKKKISDIYSDIIGGKEYSTMESLWKVRGQIELIRGIIKESLGE